MLDIRAVELQGGEAFQPLQITKVLHDGMTSLQTVSFVGQSTVTFQYETSTDLETYFSPVDLPLGSNSFQVETSSPAMFFCIRVKP